MGEKGLCIFSFVARANLSVAVITNIFFSSKCTYLFVLVTALVNVDPKTQPNLIVVVAKDAYILPLVALGYRGSAEQVFIAALPPYKEKVNDFIRSNWLSVNIGDAAAVSVAAME